MEGAEIVLQFRFVGRHSHTVHSGCCSPPQAPKCPYKRLDVDVVEQRREPGLVRPLGRVFHSKKVRQQGLPALCLAPLLLASGWGLPSGPLVSFASIISTTPQSATLFDQRAHPLVSLGICPLR